MGLTLLPSLRDTLPPPQRHSMPSSQRRTLQPSQPDILPPPQRHSLPPSQRRALPPSQRDILQCLSVTRDPGTEERKEKRTEIREKRAARTKQVSSARRSQLRSHLGSRQDLAARSACPFRQKLATSSGASQRPGALWPLALPPVAAAHRLAEVLHGNHFGAPSIEDSGSLTTKRESPCGSCPASHAPVLGRLLADLHSLRQVLPRRGQMVDHGTKCGAPSMKDTTTITKSREKSSGSCQKAHARVPRRLVSALLSLRQWCGTCQVAEPAILMLLSRTRESAVTLEDMEEIARSITFRSLVKPASAQRRSAPKCGMASESWRLVMLRLDITSLRTSSWDGSKRRSLSAS